MLLSVKHPDYLLIKGSSSNRKAFGGNQAWYPNNWAQRAGCGATSAANVTAYLAKARVEYAGLYAEKSMDREDFLNHMESLFQYVTPGPMGVNHVDKYIDGIQNYAKTKGMLLKPQVITTELLGRRRRSAQELKEFVKRAMEADCPIAFLNLSRGEEKQLQNWHWITITSVNIEEDYILAKASDEGYEREFDLLLWYLTTNMHGGLIYFE